MDVVAALASLRGVARLNQIRQLGVPRSQLAQAVAEGRAHRVGRGTYALPTADPVRIAEVAWGGRATCVTSLRTWALPQLQHDSHVHLAFVPGRNFSGEHLSPPRSVIRHFHAELSQQPPTVIEALDSSSLCTSPGAQLVAIDAALNRGLIRLDQLHDLIVTAPGRRRWLTRRADPLTQSPIETLTRIALLESGLNVRSQVAVPGVGRVDFVVNDHVIVEVDGRSYHSDERQFAEDRRRDRAALLAGYRVLRFTYNDVVGDMESLVEQVRAAVALASI